MRPGLTRRRSAGGVNRSDYLRALASAAPGVDLSTASVTLSQTVRMRTLGSSRLFGWQNAQQQRE